LPHHRCFQQGGNLICVQNEHSAYSVLKRLYADWSIWTHEISRPGNAGQGGVDFSTKGGVGGVNEQNEIMSHGENWEKSVKKRTKIYYLRALLPNLLEVKQQSIIEKIR
jgi:hypothetical protein